MEISVVIPTIGDRDILPTINSLNNSTLIPTEIIIVSLKAKTQKHINKKYKNVVFVKASKKGQVNQRIFGFKNAKNKYVVQLDSDILVNINTIELLYKEAIKDNKTCVSAKIVNKDLLKTETKINQNNSGKITIEYKDLDQFELLSDLLTKN